MISYVNDKYRIAAILIMSGVSRMDKFANVPVDENTKIKKSNVIKINDLDALHQEWIWDGIVAESLVFIEKDVGGLSDDELVNLARKNNLLIEDSQATVVRNSSGFAFVNMNFESPL